MPKLDENNPKMWDDQMKEDEMGGACSVHLGDEK
jgi:hypothetical protein